ncbi:MAG: inositol monophosphatase family protein [Planctomycetota bacterium]
MTRAKTMVEADELRTFMESTARNAGAVLMSYFGRLEAGDIDFKGRRDLLTVADRAAEELIVAAISERFPDHSILAEEAASTDPSASEKASAAKGYHWIVDPLDGTTNFVHQLPMFAVSIGLFKNDQPVAGAIYAPRLDELFFAHEGKGAILNGKPIQVSKTTELLDSLLATGFAYRVGEIAENNLDHFCHLIPRTRAVRRCGSAAMDLAYTACGRFDGFWELELSPWDVAAGAVLIREAGGVVTDMNGGDDWLFGRSIAAANHGLHPVVLAALNRT